MPHQRVGRHWSTHATTLKASSNNCRHPQQHQESSTDVCVCTKCTHLPIRRAAQGLLSSGCPVAAALADSTCWTHPFLSSKYPPLINALVSPAVIAAAAAPAAAVPPHPLPPLLLLPPPLPPHPHAQTQETPALLLLLPLAAAAAPQQQACQSLAAPAPTHCCLQGQVLLLQAEGDMFLAWGMALQDIPLAPRCCWVRADSQPGSLHRTNTVAAGCLGLLLLLKRRWCVGL